MSKASFEIAGIRFTDVDLGVCGISTVKYPSQEEVAAYERGRAAGRAEERADIVAWLRERASDFGPNYVTGYEPSAPAALEQAADKLEARAKAPAERQDGGERE